MGNVIVCTSINYPTEAVKKFDQLCDWFLIVIGDKRTPLDYKLKHGRYVSPEEQQMLYPELSELIGWNCIQRRNIGLLIAKSMGAKVICTVDDDNIPLDHWGDNVFVGKKILTTEFQCRDVVFDPIGATNYRHLWHRGFPIELVPFRDYSQSVEVEIIPKIQADFWNGDPDIDAICRMEHRPECYFENMPFPFTSSKPAPFNSQNTFLAAELIPDYFLFTGVGRMDDIWASYYVQSLGHRVVFNGASVFQARNEHNLIVDMKNEYLGYENNVQLLSDLQDNSESILKYLPQRSIKAWQAFREAAE
jgi:hypothetical protein